MHCGDCAWTHDDAPDWAHTLNHNIIAIAKEITAMSADQSHLDTDVAALVSAVGTISDEITALKAANPAVDFSGLDAAVAQVQALAPAAPVDAPPADGSAPTDGSTPTA